MQMRFFVGLQYTIEPGSFHLSQRLFPAVKASYILDDLPGGSSCFRFQQMSHLPTGCCTSFSLMILESTFGNNEIAQRHPIPVTCTDAGHSSESGTKLL